MCALASKARSDFKILTHETLQFTPELNKYILPYASNTEHNQGLLIIAQRILIKTIDKWKNFTAKLIKQTKTNVLPVYFDGKNGILFHLFASKLKNQTLKYSSYIHETKKMIGKNILYQETTKN